MSTVNEKMTALANEVRELSGTTTPKSIDAMTSDVNDANAEVSSQTDLIAQITAALENKTNVPSEDVDDETDAYTEKLASLETAITALETELEGKASGGSTVEAWTGTVYGHNGLGEFPPMYVYYTDETSVARVIVVGQGEEATITIAANTYVIIYYSNFVNPNIYDNVEEGTQRIGEYHNMTLYLPVKNNFTISP